MNSRFEQFGSHLAVVRSDHFELDQISKVTV